MSDTQPQNDHDAPESSGGYGGDTEYPLRHVNQDKRLERQALKGGWLALVEEHEEALFKRQIVDALDANSTPRDRRGSFNAIDQARHRHAQRQMANQRFDLVLMPQSEADESDVVEGQVVLTPEAVAAQLVEMQRRISKPDDSSQ